MRNYSFTETLIEDAWITDNQVLSSTHGNGGGIYAYVSDFGSGGSPKITITGSTVDNNRTTERGGGIFVCAKGGGEFVAENSTLSNNSTNGFAQ